ncbi:hypothetical protein OG453_31295 [Streptomyces sp. NBC_01381]|uniref:hypothetical protein n=1 Tax=Streptomyces sp. NBC_01381 TaxID=2903845 RepID=UPI0022565F5E|nr:hypothetical protein [Streptomyces sp. NBC_01381]MCX4671127.1 hypothetical protein [Streptomyces sp. NBC_01381]
MTRLEDVLGVRMQSAMAHAVAEIRRSTGRHLDLDNPDHVDLADADTFERNLSRQETEMEQRPTVADPGSPDRR